MSRHLVSIHGATLLFALSILVSLGGVAHASSDPAGNCHIGAYRLTNGSIVDIGATDPASSLRWRRVDGTTGLLTRHPDGTWTSTRGWTGRPDGTSVRFSDCRDGRITFDGMTGRRIVFDIVNTRFQGSGVKLAGRLVLPKGKGRVPVVVLVHGSEHDSALDYYDLQRMFPAMGIGVFVYDKRGTGASGGRYTQNFVLLADDAIAAMREAKRLARTRVGRIGYQAGSEGGWVAPLAAKIAPVDFVIVGFGLAVSPLDEDREEPWFKHVHGDVTWALLAGPTETLKERGPVLFAGVPLQYDPMPVLRNLDTPQLWILGSEDADAPSAETIKRLRGLQETGHPITLAVFPHAEHGIYEFETKPDGTREDTRNSEGYFGMMRDYILDQTLHGAYGNAVLYRASSTTPGHPS
jgi:pimeloyl-ACP methyl ester carboxylesterase